MTDNPASLFDLRSDKLIETLKRALNMLHERGLTYASAIDALQKGQSAAVDSLVGQITSNFSTLFTNASVVVTALQEGRYTSADVTGPVLFAAQNGLSLSLDVTGPVGFAPAPVVMIGRKANTTDKAVARVVSWSVETGTLVVDIVAPFGTVGPHSDCYVEVGLLSALAESEILLLVQAARNQVAADRDAVATDRQLAGGHKDTANTAAGTAVSAAGVAVQAALEAQTWNPENYYRKSEVDTALGAEASTRAAAIAPVRDGTAKPVVVNSTVAVGERIKASSSAGAITVTLPASPAEGEHVTIWRDGANAVTIARNGKTIENVAENLVLDVDKRGVRLTYLFGTWKAFPAEVVL